MEEQGWTQPNLQIDQLISEWSWEGLGSAIKSNAIETKTKARAWYWVNLKLTHIERKKIFEVNGKSGKNLDMRVEEYWQQMELLLLRAGLREEEITSIARFLSRLNMEVRDKVVSSFHIGT